MNKKLLTAAAVLFAAVDAQAQLPASTTPQNRKVLLEEFTGIYCQYCPDGHKKANELKAAKPAGAVIISNIHTGSFAGPTGGDPDYRTAEGNAIAAIPGTGITGYPTGSISRHTFVGQGGFAINRGDWARYVDSMLAKPSYVNLALQGSLNVTTRELTVTVQAYFTANSTATADNLTVELLEDGVRGPQIDSGPYYPAMRNADGTYTHNHMLRKVLTTAATGEAISPTTMGTTINKTYTYMVPQQFVNNATQMGNLHIIAFIAQGSSEVITAAEGPIALTGFTYTRDADMKTVTSENEVCIGKLNPSITFYNNGSSTITAATFTYNANGGTNSTYNFAGTINPATSATITLPELSFTPTASNVLNVTVTGVNGATDENAANNILTKSAIALTTLRADDQSMIMEFKQDQWGTESSWKVFEESTNTIVGQDGPFTNLAAVGTQVHMKGFRVDPSKCYRLEVSDSYGDGINGGFGAGSYKLSSANVALVTSNGQFGKKDNRWYKSNTTLTNTVGVGNVANSIDEMSVFPNPAYETATLKFNLVENTKVQVSVFDAMGRLAAVVADKDMTKGLHNVTINTATLPAGLYSIKVQTTEGATTQRMTVLK